MEQTIITILASGSFASVITWLITGKKKNDNLIADTAAKIAQASSATIERLTTRVTTAENALDQVVIAQTNCEDREKRLNDRLEKVEKDNRELRKQLNKK